MTGRFAPSPSGRMHLGNIYCALMAWLSARSAGGRLVLRIEDLDPARCRPQYTLQLIEDLRWLGLDWDEGGLDPGLCAPYCQSPRGALYEEHLRLLDQRGLLYPCWCTRADLYAAGAPHVGDDTPVYSGRCRELTRAQQAELAGSPCALRLRVPAEVRSFTDGHLGPYSQDLQAQCGDFIVKRRDGGYAYQLAVVVDDARMGVTQVVRGQDLLASTLRQLYLYELLGYEPPRFCHLPLLLAPDGRRLSKREKSLDMGCLKDRFATPEKLVGQIAALCGLLERPEPLSPRELVPLFDWEKLPRRDITLGQEWFHTV